MPSEDGKNEHASAVAGTWQLVRSVAVSSDGASMPAPYGGDAAMGRLVLDPGGRMMAVLCDSRAEMPEGAMREYMSYCGNYTFDGKTLITRVDASSDPERVGTDQVRDVSFEGDLMVLRPPLRAYASAPEQRTLHWRKISDT